MPSLRMRKELAVFIINRLPYHQPATNMKRRKESEVIIEAYKRTEALLGTEARCVTDHLLVIVNFEELT